MSDDYEGQKQVKARMYAPDRQALDELVAESDEWGNRSDALRGLIRAAASGEVADDGGPPEEPDRYYPSNATLRVVYEHALDHVADDHELDYDMLGSVAQSINNDPDTPLTPDADTVEQYLLRLQSDGYAWMSMDLDLRGEGGKKFTLKPTTAIPGKWRLNEDKVRERRRRRKEDRVERILTRRNFRTPEETVELYRSAGLEAPEGLLKQAGMAEKWALFLFSLCQLVHSSPDISDDTMLIQSLQSVLHILASVSQRVSYIRRQIPSLV